MSNIGSGVLLRDEIEKHSIISKHSVETSYQAASYDLRVGDSWVPTDDGTQRGVIDRFVGQDIVVPAFGSIIVSTHEVLKLPLNVVGKFNLRIKLALKGLFVQMGTQIEPGYYGRLFAVLNNITEQDIVLKIIDPEGKVGEIERDPIFTVEFFTTIGKAPALEKHKNPVLKINQWVRSSSFASSSISSVVKNVKKNEGELGKLQKQIVDQQDAVLKRVEGDFGGRLDLLKTEWESRKDVASAKEDLFSEKTISLERQYQTVSAELQKTQANAKQFFYSLGGAGIFLIFMSALVPFIFSYALDQSSSWWERGTVEASQREMQALRAQLEALRAGTASNDVVNRLIDEVGVLQSTIIDLEAKIEYIETQPSAEGSPSPGEN